MDHHLSFNFDRICEAEEKWAKALEELLHNRKEGTDEKDIGEIRN